MSHYRMPILDETGFAMLSPYTGDINPREWLDLTYVEWRSSGITRFAPLASAYGEIECNGFWHHTPPKPDKNGVWIDSQAAMSPTLIQRIDEVGANVGRCRVIELQPNSYSDALYNSHLDDNNRLNPDGEGWVVRCFMQLTDNPDSFMIVRTDIDDPNSEVRIPLRAGTQFVVDSERLWHSVWHQGSEPRYCLITSFESGPELEKWIWENNPVTSIEQVPLDPDLEREQRADGMARRAARCERYGYDPTRVTYDEA